VVAGSLLVIVFFRVFEVFWRETEMRETKKNSWK
jgi:hypothetical protein